MPEILEHLITLVFLVLLQAVLGFDNLLYISLESKRAPLDQQSKVRKLGIGIAIAARIVLLFVLVSLIKFVQDAFLVVDTSWFHCEMTLHALITLGGGAFIMYTAVKEIWHMVSLEEHEEAVDDTPRSVASIVAMIVAMNLVFSFDSILSAMALAQTVPMDDGTKQITTAGLVVMSLAIVIGGVLMILLADTVSNFLQKNRMYEVLGLFVLLIVGVMLLSEGGHLAHIWFFDEENEVQAMSKTTFYFVIGVLVLVDVVQSRYQRKLLAKKEEKAKVSAAEAVT